MQSVDGDVRLSVSFDMKSVQTNLVQLKKAIKDTLGGFDSVDSKVTPQVADLEKELANATDKINELTKEVEKLSKTKLDKTFDGADKQVEKATNEAKELKAQKRKPKRKQNNNVQNGRKYFQMVQWTRA